jgi:hypothetical protein
MTQAFNLSQVANYANSAGQIDASTGLFNATQVANGGTGATTATNAKIGIEVITSATGSEILPVGTTAERDVTPQAGYIRFNSDTGQFEGYNGVIWTAVGGGNTTNTGLWENAQDITTDYSITSGNNAMSAGPITIDAGVEVTVPTGSRWIVF